MEGRSAPVLFSADITTRRIQNLSKQGGDGSARDKLGDGLVEGVQQLLGEG